MKYFAKRLNFVADTDRKSFASLLNLSHREDGNPVRFILYQHFHFPKSGGVTKLSIFLPHQEEDAKESKPFGIKAISKNVPTFYIPGHLEWLRLAAMGVVMHPRWIEINSPLNFCVRSREERILG